MPKNTIDTETDNVMPLHASPVTLADAYAKDDAFMRKVANGALESHLNFEDLGDLVVEMNETQTSPSLANGGSLGVMARVGEELKPDQIIRERAYLLWELAAKPDGRSDEFWHKALLEDVRERAYALWESEGSPEGKADEHWYRVGACDQR